MILRVTRTWVSLTIGGFGFGTNLREVAIRTPWSGTCHTLPSLRLLWREVP